jgi:diacylglycerol kinase (ATP)
LARNLGIPIDLEGAARVAATGNLRRIDLPQLDDEPFVVMSGSGFDALLFEKTSEGLKSRIGWAAYALAGAKAIRAADRLQITLEVDGRVEVVPGIGVVVGNVGTLTGGMVLFPDAIPDDGILDLAVLRPNGLRGWVGLAVNIVAGRRIQPWHVEYRHGADVVVRWPKTVPIELDGDLREPADRCSYTMSPQALDVCVPADSDAPETTSG